MSMEKLAALAERMEPVRQALEDDWYALGVQYDQRGDETRLSLVTRALITLLNELKVEAKGDVVLDEG